MAISRFNVKIGKRGKGTPHLEYICGQDRYANKQGVMLTQSGNMPSWATQEPAKFWRAADEYERANGQTYKEHTLSLPRELTLEQQKKVVDGWITQELGTKHPYTYAIHHAQAQDGGLNTHAHLMFSERQMDGIERDEAHFFKRANKKEPAKGGAVKANTGLSPRELKKNLLNQRERWGEHLRECLRVFGLSHVAEKIDMRNWKERGLSEPPDNKSMSQIQMEKKLDAYLEQKTRPLTKEQEQALIERYGDPEQVTQGWKQYTALQATKEALEPNIAGTPISAAIKKNQLISEIVEHWDTPAAQAIKENLENERKKLEEVALAHAANANRPTENPYERALQVAIAQENLSKLGNRQQIAEDVGEKMVKTTRTQGQSYEPNGP